MEEGLGGKGRRREERSTQHRKEVREGGKYNFRAL